MRSPHKARSAGQAFVCDFLPPPAHREDGGFMVELLGAQAEILTDQLRLSDRFAVDSSAVLAHEKASHSRLPSAVSSPGAECSAG